MRIKKERKMKEKGIKGWMEKNDRMGMKKKKDKNGEVKS